MQVGEDIQRPDPARRRRAIGIGTAAIVAFLVLTGLVAVRFRPVRSVDSTVSESARRFALDHAGWRTFMSVVTHSADARLLIPLGLLAVALLLWRRQSTSVAFLLITATAATALRHATLALVARPRPADRLTPSTGWAYPSGHTTSATIAAGIVIMLALSVLATRRARTGLVAAAATWAVLVGISRVALVAHWPTDVIGGWLLATAVTAAMSLSPLRPRSSPSVEVPQG